ncbi:MAG: NYN domain-containing protein [Patescibacteria group bacterium]
MFSPKTERIKKLAILFSETILELEKLFGSSANVYIDWQNVIHWQEKLGWHFDLRRIKQFLDSFNGIKSIKIYTGTFDGNQQSEEQIKELKNLGYVVATKPVKLMKMSIDVSSISKDSPAILKNFIKKSLLSKLDIETIEYLNNKLVSFNKQGILYIEEPKCNFDVEIGRDMQKDFESYDVQNYILWSTDSDFADPITQIRNDGRSAVIFAVSGKVAPELDATNTLIFDVRKIREFTCWPREIPQSIKSKIDAL